MRLLEKELRVPRSPSRLRRYGAACALVLCAVVVPAAAQPAAENGAIVVPRVDRPPQLDDYVAGEPADAGVKLSDFRQFLPGDGDPVSTPTTAYLSYDDRNLYAVFVVHDDPKLVRAHLAKREDVFQDDAVEILLDTYDDNQRAYLFYVNPFGVQLDGIFTEGKGYDFDFDTLWYSAGQLTASGWVAQITVPWKSLRFPSAPQQRWGFVLGRINPRASEYAYFPPLTRRVGTIVSQYGTLELPSAISPGRNFQVIPYAAASRARLLDAPRSAAAGEARYRDKDDSRVGVDAKLVWKDSVTFDLTVKPDFSQVESDEPQVLVNQRFEVFFPEKRPFFLENAAFFSLPINLFFSRRIAEPEYGARVTGKAGRWVFGGLAIDDVAPANQPGVASADARAGIGVLRLQREIGAQSNLGLLASSRSFGGETNSVLSLDSRLQLDANWSLTMQAAASRADEGGEEISGSAASVALAHQGLHWTYAGSYADIARDFRSQLGFVPRVDIRQLKQNLAYSFLPAESKVAMHGPSLAAVSTWDQGGEAQDWEATASYSLRLVNATTFSASYSLGFERFLGHEFSKHVASLSTAGEPLSWFNYSASYSRGNAINFAPAAGLAPFLGDEETFLLLLGVKPTPRFSLEETYIYVDLSLRGALPPVAASGRTVFVNNLLRSKANYQFSRSLSLRVILDYQRLSPNASLVQLADTRRWVGDVLFTYLPNPGTAIFVGYADNQENLAIVPAAASPFARDPGARLTTGRQVFVKVSYLFRF